MKIKPKIAYRRNKFFSFFIQILNRGFVTEHEFDVEPSEHCEQTGQQRNDEESYFDKHGLQQFILIVLVLCRIISVELPVYGVHEIESHCANDEITHREGVEQQQHEVFSVPESHAVVDPRAVMVHVEHTSVAL